MRELYYLCVLCESLSMGIKLYRKYFLHAVMSCLGMRLALLLYHYMYRSDMSHIIKDQDALC